MDFSKYTIGVGITGSFCTHNKVKGQIRALIEQGATIIPIFSYQTQQTDTRFGIAKDFVQEITDMTAHSGIRTISQAEPIGPRNLLDIMLIAPCTGNTLAKLCVGIVDTPVLMAAKAHLRNQKPLVIAISTNDALGMNYKNIATLMQQKNIFFVPYGQDQWQGKPNSMIAKWELVSKTLESALEGEQLQPVLAG